MSSQELTKKCPYDGCDYVSKASSAHALEHNVATHVSNSHRGITTVWYGGGKVTIHRDVKSNSFTCPCGEYSSSNAASVRRHAKNVHHNMSKVVSAARASKSAVVSKPKTDEDGMYRVVDPNPKDRLDIGGGEVWVPTGPTVVHKAYPLVAMTPMGPPEKNISARVSASTSASSSSKGASSSVSKSKSIASTSASPAHPLSTPIPSAGLPTSRSVPTKRKVEEPVSGPSKVRRADNAPSVSASTAIASSSKTITPSTPVRKLLLASSPSKSKTSATIPSDSASTSKKRPADDSLPEPSPSKIQRMDTGSAIAKKTTKPAKSVTPLKTPDVSTRKVATTKDKIRPIDNAPPVSTTASTGTAPTPAKAPPKPRPVVKPSATVHTQAKAPASSPSKADSKKHARPPPAVGVAASSASSGFSTSTRGSSSSASSSARTSATPVPSRADPSSSTAGPSKNGNCSNCGGQIGAYGQNGVMMCTMCYAASLLAAPPPAPLSLPLPARCVTCGNDWPTKGDQCAKCQFNPPRASNSNGSSSLVENGDLAPIAVAPNPSPGRKASLYQKRKPTPTPTPNPNAKPTPTPNAKPTPNSNPNPTVVPKPAKQQKPRKKRVSRAARQLEFERWFARWTAAHRARAVSKPKPSGSKSKGGTDKGEGGEDEDKTDWWRVQTTRNQGGVCYATPEAFFFALEAVLAGHRRRHSAKDDGKGTGGVLTFYGGYSIVAQPKISAIERLDMLVSGMEGLGFRLDSALQGHVKFQYKSAPGTVDEVYKYPCTCGGTPPSVGENEMRHAHRIPDAKFAGEVCGGTIMLMVGQDNAQLAYGIQGQRIAVDIIH